MPKFAVKEIISVRGKYKFFQLVIDEGYNSTLELNDKTGILDEYENNLEDRYKSDFRNMQTTMNLVANLKPVPDKKFKKLKGSRGFAEFEFKNGDLRVYGIAVPGGKLIILGGYKNDQSKDIRRMRSLKRQVIDSLNNQLDDGKKRLT